MRSLLRRSALVLGGLLLGVSRSHAFEPDDRPLWPDGTITMQLQMGSSPTLSDGTTWNTTVDEALKQWNRNLGRVQFTSVIGSSAPIGEGNGYNNVVFRKDVFGDAFGENVLAVAISYTNSTARTESDVIFNSAETWDSYRGSLGYTKTDIRRVALHEFGHVLGLTHPDEAGQYVTAVMNSLVSDVDALQQDDTEGAAFLYGPGIDNPYTPPTISSHPYSRSVTEGQSTSFYVNAYGQKPLSYQWRKDGNDIPGATNTTYSIDIVRQSNAGSYSAVVTNPGGSVTSSAATLTVTAATPPSFRDSIPPHPGAELGSAATIDGPHVNGSRPITYQWYKDDAIIPGEILRTLTINPVSQSDGGTYVLEARNIAGSVRSNGAVLSILAQALPSKTRLSYNTPIVGQPLSLYSSTDSDDRTYAFQWFKDGQPIGGATQYSLTFSSLAATDGGEYLRVATNESGAISSQAITLVPQTAATSTADVWLRAYLQAETIYFLYANPARIERYHKTAGWLNPIALSATPSTFAVHESGIYVALNGTIRRYALDGTGETILATASGTVSGLKVWKEFLIVRQTPYSDHSAFITLRRDTGATVATSPLYSYALQGLSLASIKGRLLGRNQYGLSSVEYVDLNTDGTYLGAGKSPYSSSFLPATRTWVSPDETQIADNSGTVYNVADLTLAGSLGGSVTDLAFHNGGWVALRNDTLALYDSHFKEVGQTKLTTAGQAMFILGDEAVIFCIFPGTTRNIEVIRQSLTGLSTNTPIVTTIAPPRSILPVDDVSMDKNGVVHILSRPYRNLFRWSASTRSFLDSIPLRGSPNDVCYPEQFDRVILGYERRSTQIKLSGNTLSEMAFANLPMDAAGMAAVDEWILFAHQRTYASTSFTYNAAGERVASGNAQPFTASAWNPAKRRLYHLNSSYPDYFRADEILNDGTFGESKYVYYPDYSIKAPIRVSPDGASLLLGSGTFLDATTLQKNDTLPHGVNDAAWLNGTLFTVRNLAVGAEIQRWSSPDYALEKTSLLAGRLLRLFPWGTDKLVGVGLRNGYLFFAVIGADLTIHSIDENKPLPRLANLSSRAQVGTGDKVLISGFVIGGSGKKSLLLRAVGPTLTDYGVTGELANPRLTLFNSQGSPIDTNDNWSSAPNLDELVSRSKAIGAAGLRSASKDAALLASLDPGLYTVHVTGVSDTTGVGLVELFDADSRDSTARLINISTRAQVGAGDGILIPGIVVDGDAPVTVLIRAVGPSLVKHGVSDALADPQFQILDRDAKVIASNDDWWSGTDLDLLNFTSKQVGAGTLDSYSKDAAVVATLPPGIYTVHVKGVNNTTGVALVEVFYASP